MKVSALLKGVGKKGHQGTPCFAQFLKGDAKEFMEQIVAMVNEGEYVNKLRSHAILTDELGVDIGISVFSRHLKRKCGCDKE